MRWLRLACGLFAFAAWSACAHLGADWNDTLLEIDLKSPNPHAYARAAAILNVAMFDAANAVEKRFVSYRPAPSFAEPASAQAAAAAAAHAVLVELHANAKDLLDRRLADALAAVPDGEPRSNGVRLGIAVAQALLAERAADQWFAPDTYRPRTEPGRYVPTAHLVNAGVASARPWVVPRADLYRPLPPPSLASAQWARDLEEVRTMGGVKSALRSEEQAMRARLVAISHTRFYMQPVAAVVRDQRMPLLEGLRVLALEAVAIADATIASFDAKYHYAFWRPVTAIRNADLDGNDATQRDASWTPLVDTPMHPEYPCHHCVIGAVTAAVFRNAFGEHAPALRLRNPAFAARLEIRVEELAQLMIDARVHSGIHYRSSGLAGAELGRRVAEHVVREALRPRP
jgi:hypothetical protein